jgi:uncharacterized tellurite resistance protein B-like protein
VLAEELGRAYAGALVAIARADGDLVIDEILRIRALIAQRVGAPIDDATLYADDLTVADVVAAAQRQHGDPFRTAGVSPRELGRMLIEDGLALALADGHAHEAELAMIVELAHALGCTNEDVDQLRGRLPEWLVLDLRFLLGDTNRA